MQRKQPLDLPLVASLLCGSLLWAALGPGARPAAAAGVTEIASLSSSGTQGDQDSIHAAVTADGRFVAFASLAGNLVPGDTNDTADIFVRDRLTGTTERVSVSSRGAQGNGPSGFLGFRSKPSISADGRFVAFSSEATNLVRRDQNGTVDVFVHDRATGATERVSVATGGAETNGFSIAPAISADGRFVAFQSDATNIAAPDEPFPKNHIYVHDRQTGTTERASVDSSGVPGDDASQFPDISPNGRIVAFVSSASNLVPDAADGFPQVFVHDRQTGATERVSEDAAGNPGDFGSELPSLSGDGRFVAFVSAATNFVPGDTPIGDVFVADRQAGTLERVSEAPGGAPANESSFEPAISSDGRFVAFSSFASNLVAGDDGQMDVFVHDRQTGTTAKVSVNSEGDGGELASDLPALSDDGQVVAFESFSTNLVPADDNSAKDVFVNDRRSADLAVTMTDAPDPAAAKSPVTYTVTVENGGPSPVAAVSLTDTLPATARFASATASQGSCSRAGSGPTGGTLTCDLGTFASGAAATVTVVVKPSKAGTLTNTATARGLAPDPDPANNTATETTTVR